MKSHTRYGGMIAIACIALIACLAIAPSIATADQPYSSTPTFNIDANTGTTVIVSGDHNTVTFVVDQHRNTPSLTPPRSALPDSGERSTTMLVSRTNKRTTNCEVKHQEHADTLSRWAMEMRTIYHGSPGN